MNLNLEVLPFLHCLCMISLHIYMISLIAVFSVIMILGVYDFLQF